MYSGITQGLYPVTKLKRQPSLLQYALALPLPLREGLKPGDSVAVNGVCQTVVAIDKDNVFFDAMQETLNKTTLNRLSLGTQVSIERSLRHGDENGGHAVSGHVYGTGVVVKRHCPTPAATPGASSLSITIECAPEWMKYILTKGFIAVDGSSLTIGETDTVHGQFTLHLIPETLRRTNFATLAVGDNVNIEFDQQTKTIVDTVFRVLENQKIA